MEKNNRLFLIDANSLIYRAFYAFIRNPRINSKGQNTSAIFGFVNSLIEVLQKNTPSHIGVVFDPAGPTFRNEIYPEYKAQREETPEDIQNAIPNIKQIINALQIPVIEIPYYEADDVIGTLAKQAEKHDITTYMVTTDKDYAQLVSDSIFLYKPRRSGENTEILGIQQVCEQYNISHPEQVRDIFALWGDKSDNIPGVPGIGEKRAKELISKYETIDNLTAHIDELKGKLKENLQNYQETMKLSKQLFTIDINAPAEFDWNKFTIGSPDKDILYKVLQELELYSIIERLLPEFKTQTSKSNNTKTKQGTLFPEEPAQKQTSDHSILQNISKTEHNYQLIDTKEKRDHLIHLLKQQESFCFDTETTSLDPHASKLVGIAFCFKSHEAYYVSINQDNDETIADEFKQVFEDSSIMKIGQNLKYDIRVLRNYNIRVKGKLFDTMVAHYLLDPESRHNMKFLSEKYLQYAPVEIEELIGKKGKDQAQMNSVSLDTITEYAGEDADITWQLYRIFEPELQKNRLYELFTNLEIPLIYVLVEMEEAGVSLNINSLKEFEKELQTELKHLEEGIIKMAGVQFNVGSPKQLGEVLFEHLNIDPNAKRSGKSKQYSTSEEVLMKFRDKHEIIPKILDFRSIKKLLNSYVETLPKLIDQKTGKIHTSFGQTTAATGRLSSTNPNLQNIPIREERGRKMREAFVPSSSKNKLLAADYSQIELRLMAHMSEDKNMISAFQNNEDIHTSTAAKINNVSHDQVTKEMRSQAKTANFGIIYGISAFGLAQRLGIGKSEARKLIDGYFQSYPGVKTFMDNQISFAREHEYVTTIKGRKRFLRDINSRNNTVRSFAERNAINAPIQGSAADIIKIAMINIQEKLQMNRYKSQMILQVHDELIFDGPEDELSELRNMIIYEMEHAMSLKVPLIVESGLGNNWLEAH